MAITKTYHPEYEHKVRDWKRADDVHNERVHAEKEKYLPLGDSLPGSTNEAREFNEYQRLKYDTTTHRMAVFYNFCGLTLSAVIGAIMRKPASTEFAEGDKDSVLDYLQKNADGKGNGLTQLAKMALVNLYNKGNCGILTTASTFKSPADAMMGKGVPRLVLYRPESILDWDTDYIDGEEVLTYLLLREKTRVRNTETGAVDDDVERLIAFSLVDGVVMYQVELDGVSELDADNDGILRKNGATVDRIPFHRGGAFNNDWKTDPAPMRTLVDLNLLHYVMLSRDMQGRWDTAAIKLAVDIGIEDNAMDDFEKLNPMGLNSTSSTAVVTMGGSVQFLQANESNLLSKAPSEILEMAKLAGANLFQDGASNETATGAEIRSGNSTATMSSVAGNTGCMIRDAIIDAAGYFGDIGNIDLDQIKFDLNKEFFPFKLSAADTKVYADAVMQGTYPMQAYFEILLKNGDLKPDTDYTEFQNMMREDNGMGGMPDVTGGNTILNGSE